MAAPNPKLKIPVYENYASVDSRLGEAPARPKAAACPPQQEQAATKRQASCESQLQPPPKQFLSPEDQNQNGEQRPDAAKKARPPSPPGELRAKTKEEWLSLSAHERMRLQKGEDMEVIHYSAIPFDWRLPQILSCTKKGCNPLWLHLCMCSKRSRNEGELLAGEATTKDVWIFWNENAKHNSMEDPGHPGSEIPYADRLGCAIATAFITWRANG